MIIIVNFDFYLQTVQCTWEIIADTVLLMILQTLLVPVLLVH